VSWIETASLSFTARHDSAQADDAAAVLDDLEAHRNRLEELFPRLPGNVTVILHDSPAQLWLAHPMLLLSRRMASRSARRYVAAWYRADEVHTLSPPVLRAQAAGPDSARAMLLSPRRAYTALVVGVNNPLLPPPGRPAAHLRALRRPWVLHGAAQHFAGQVPLLRAAIAMRLRQGRIPFPPGPRDAPLLAGSVFDLLARERGEPACVRLATHPYGSTPDAVTDSFERSMPDMAHAWRTHLERLATPDPGVSEIHAVARPPAA
jgi:hypothetical protein